VEPAVGYRHDLRRPGPLGHHAELEGPGDPVVGRGGDVDGPTADIRACNPRCAADGDTGGSIGSYGKGPRSGTHIRHLKTDGPLRQAGTVDHYLAKASIDGDEF